MKKVLLRASCIGILLMLAFCSICLAKSSNTLKKIQGHWVDVNGDTELDIDEKEIVISFGKWSETYPYKLEETGYSTKLVGTPPEGFGLLGDIELRSDGSLQSYEQILVELRSDGSLQSYEQILDAEGHSYRFVREEDLEKELEIQDLSEDMPKSIESDDITDFSLVFDRSFGYGLGDEWPMGYYSWQIEKEDDSYNMSFNIMGSSYIVFRWDREVSAEYIRGLAEKLEELGIPEHNGYYMKNNASDPGYYLYAEYASDEKLEIRAEGTPAEKCVFDLPGLLEYARELFGDELEEAY